MKPIIAGLPKMEEVEMSYAGDSWSPAKSVPLWFPNRIFEILSSASGSHPWARCRSKMNSLLD